MSTNEESHQLVVGSGTRRSEDLDSYDMYIHPRISGFGMLLEDG